MWRAVSSGASSCARASSRAREPLALGLVVQDRDSPHEVAIPVPQRRRTGDDLHFLPIKRTQPNLARIRSCSALVQNDPAAVESHWEQGQSRIIRTTIPHAAPCSL
jgi:hypothetical protein